MMNINKEAQDITEKDTVPVKTFDSKTCREKAAQESAIQEDEATIMENVYCSSISIRISIEKVELLIQELLALNQFLGEDGSFEECYPTLAPMREYLENELAAFKSDPERWQRYLEIVEERKKCEAAVDRFIERNYGAQKKGDK
jgi:hypothetical protein